MQAESKKTVEDSFPKISRQPPRQAVGQPQVAPTADTRSDYLLDVAAEVFLEKGFEATSVGEIARRARASKETYYTLFNNKNELFRAVIQHLTDSFAAEVDLALGIQQKPMKALSAFGAALLGRLLGDKHVGLQSIVFMESRRFPEVASIFYEFGPRRTLAALSKYFDAQVKSGLLRKMDTKLAASHFVALLTADTMMLRSLGLLGKPTAEDQRKRCREAVDVFLRAYAA